MKTKLFTLFLALVASVGTLLASDVTIDGIWYDFDDYDLTASVTYSGSLYYSLEKGYSGSVIIPASVTYNSTTYSVTSIGEYAFYDCSGLTSVIIPNSVTSIGDDAFYGCSSLTSISIPNSVTSIGEYAFRGCSGLTSIDIPNSVTSIGEYAFSGCSGLTSVTIGNSVTSIGVCAFSGCSGLTSINIPSVTSIEHHTFSGCSSLTSVTIPNSVTSIGDYAFNGCSGLTSITIPNSVTSIGDYAFNGCSGLTSMSVEDGNTVYDSRDNCNAIIETSTNTLIAGCKNTIIPNSVTSIGNAAFRDCSSMTSIDIPNSVTSIGDNAFSGCSGLTSVTIGNSVTSIGGYAFYGCSGLSSVTIPNSVTSIGEYAFRSCGLTSVTISNSVISIHSEAFEFEISIKFLATTPPPYPDGFGCLYIHVPGAGLYNYATTWYNCYYITADFSDEEDNTSVFASMVGMGWDNPAIDFELGRTLYKDGYYNTLCLPFDLDDLVGTPLEGATVKEFVNAEVVDGCLELNVTDASSIEAGKPYLVSFESGEDMTDAVFEEVTIATSTAQTIDGGAVDFVGILAPTDLELNNTNMLFLGANNELYWPNTNDPLRGYRAYFAVNSGSSAPVRYGMPARIVEQQNTATAIGDNAVAFMPEKKLVNGELVISRGSSSYNVLGMTIR